MTTCQLRGCVWQAIALKFYLIRPPHQLVLKHICHGLMSPSVFLTRRSDWAILLTLIDLNPLKERFGTVPSCHALSCLDLGINPQFYPITPVTLRIYVLIGTIVHAHRVTKEKAMRRGEIPSCGSQRVLDNPQPNTFFICHACIENMDYSSTVPNVPT